jgi:putative Ca2+/H+ antiporter (TMEM165/GDT1 family)
VTEGISPAYIVPLAFWTVLIAELVGDKAIYTLTSLTLRFRAGLVFIAFAVASSAKMLVAVMLGSFVIRFQSHWTYVISGVAFFISAILIWRDEPGTALPNDQPRSESWTKGALACFAAFFFTEWGDPGQISAAALVLKSHMVLGTWLGGTLALMAKGAVAMTIGMQIRHRLPQRTLRLVASASCCVLGVLALSESVWRNL